MKCFAHTGGSLTDRALAPWCVCLWLCVTSCSPTPTKPTNPAQSSPALPTLGQVRSRLPQEVGLIGLPGSTPGDQLAAMLHVSQLDVPLHALTEPAWALTDPQGLDPTAVNAWRANGLRVGLLKPADYEPFLEALATRYPARNRRTIITEQPIACTTAPKHKDPQTVRLAMPPTLRVSGLRVGPGRFQFLAQLAQKPHDTVLLQLTPHHYQPRATIQPRMPQDKIQDGMVFHDLALSVPVSDESWLVIGLDTPQAAPTVDEVTDNTPAASSDPSPAENPATARPATQPTTQPRTLKPTHDDIPNHLGRALFTASRFNKPIQIVMIVAVTGPSAAVPRQQDP